MELTRGQEEYTDVVRLPDDARAAIMAQVRGERETFRGIERRQTARAGCAHRMAIRFEVLSPDGSFGRFLVKPLNISPGGLAFQHGGPLYKDSPCRFVLHTLGGGLTLVGGAVMRCQRTDGAAAYDVGVRLNELVDPEVFVDGCVKADAASTLSVGLPHLSGDVLFVEDSVMDRRLLHAQLRSLGVRPHRAVNGGEALQMMQAGDAIDVVVTDVLMPRIGGPELARQLREAGFTGPIVAVTGDKRQETADEAMAGGCTHVLAKPHNFEDLLHILEQSLPECEPPDSEAALAGAMCPQVAPRPVVLDALSQLEDQVDRLFEAIRLGRSDQAVPLCHELKSAADARGYRSIMEAAVELEALLVGGEALDDIKPRVDAMRQFCVDATEASGRPNSE